MIMIMAATLILGCDTGQEDASKAPEPVDNTLIIATCDGSPPFSYFDENNNLIGWNIDYCEEISKRLGVPVEVKSVVWDTIIAGLQAEKFDAIVGTMSITPERQKIVAFTDVYFKDGTTVCVKDDSGITDLEGLKGKRIGVTSGSNYEQDAMQYIPEGEVVTYKDEVTQYEDLALGRIDAIVCSRYCMAYAGSQHNYPFYLFPENLYDDPCGIAVRMEDTELHVQLNEVVQAINTDGTYQELNKKWFGAE